jgi:SAM-dependent methyltransferase
LAIAYSTLAAVPLARLGWDVLGLDLSEPMLEAANRRAQEQGLTDRLHVQLAPMGRLPVTDDSFDFIVAHGIWNPRPSSQNTPGSLAATGPPFSKACFGNANQFRTESSHQDNQAVALKAYMDERKRKP